MTFRTWEGFGAMLSLSILFSSLVAVLVVYEPLTGSHWISWVVVSAYFAFEVMGVVSWGYCALVHPGVRKKKFGTSCDTPHNVPRRTHMAQGPGNSSKLAPLPPILDGDEERGVEGPNNTYTQTQIKPHAQAGIRAQNDAHTHTQMSVQEPTHTPLQSPRALTYSVATAHSGGYQQQTGDNWTENIDESTPMLLDQAPDSQSYRSLCSQSSIISGFCRECNVVIDLSTKHCSRCGVCVPNFDHHCVFMNNCIGERNYTAFILTCLCFFVSSGIEAAWCFYLGYTDTYSRTWPLYMNALLGLTAVGVFGMLLFFHWHLYRIGLSTYEYFLSQNQWGGRLYDGLSSLGSTS